MKKQRGNANEASQLNARDAGCGAAHVMQRQVKSRKIAKRVWLKEKGRQMLVADKNSRHIPNSLDANRNAQTKSVPLTPCLLLRAFRALWLRSEREHRSN